LLCWYIVAFGLGRYDERIFNLEQRLLTQARIVIMYARMILIPELSLFSLFHDIPHSESFYIPKVTLLSVLAIILALFCCVMRKPLLISFPLAWFLGGHLLESTFLPLELAHEHRNYLPSIGLFFFVIFLGSAALKKYRRGHHFSSALIAIYTLLLAVITSIRVDYWSDSYEHSALLAARHPNSGRVQYEYGRLLLKAYSHTHNGQLLEAATDAIEKAVELPNARPHLAIAAALILAIERDEESAVEYYTAKAADYPSLGTAGGVFFEVVKCQLTSRCPEKTPEQVLNIAGALLETNAVGTLDQQTVRRALAVYYLNGLGEVDHALNMLRVLHEESPLDPAIAWQYADALSFHGEKQLAAQVVSQLLRKKPWYFSLRERLIYTKLSSLVHAEAVTSP
jgi:tetratricopeptide (TPR) repeat protein